MITEIEKLKRIKDLRVLLNDDTVDIDEIRAYSIQLETLLPEPTKTLYVDADSLQFYIAYSPTNVNTVTPIEGGTFIGKQIDNTEELLQKAFLSIVDDVVAACRLESLKGNMVRFKDYKLVFTPSTNFRYDIYPKYKFKRLDKEQSEDLIKLKKWTKSIGLVVEGVEADDVVAHYGRRGHPIASGDKDVIYGVEGSNYFYHSAHRKVVHTTKEDADLFVLLQTLAGDSGDDIEGIKGIGLKIEKDKDIDGISVIKAPKAFKLLSDKPTFKDVINAYENHIICIHCLQQPRALAVTMDKVKDLECDGDITGTCNKCKTTRIFYRYTKEDAILARQLVGLDQWKGFRRGLKLFKGDKKC